MIEDCETCKWGPLNSCRRTRCTYEKIDNDFLRKKQEFNFLDSLDLPEDFFAGYVDELMDWIDSEYGEKYQEEQEIKDEYLFDLISEDEFIDWVRRRFPRIRFGEEVRRYFI